MEKLRQGGKVCAAWGQLGSNLSAEIMAEAGFDMIVFDMEHDQITLQAYEDMLDCSVSRYITAMAHPFHAVNCRPYDFSVPIAQIEDREFTRIFDKTARKGIAVEINLGCVCDLEAESVDHIERSPHMRIFRLAKECGCQFIFGSDSHAPESLFRNRWADSVVQLLELREEDILPLARI